MPPIFLAEVRHFQRTLALLAGLCLKQVLQPMAFWIATYSTNGFRSRSGKRTFRM